MTNIVKLPISPRLQNALTPDHHSKSAYVGRVHQTETVTIWDENGQPVEKQVSFPLSWDSISKIMGLIQNRAHG